MANHPSAKKRHRQSVKRYERNRSIRSRMRRALRDARAAIASNAEDRESRVSEAIRIIQRTASKKVIHKNTASRYVSRLAQADKRA